MSWKKYALGAAALLALAVGKSSAAGAETITLGLGGGAETMTLLGKGDADTVLAGWRHRGWYGGGYYRPYYYPRYYSSYYYPRYYPRYYYPRYYSSFYPIYPARIGVSIYPTYRPYYRPRVFYSGYVQNYCSLDGGAYSTPYAVNLNNRITEKPYRGEVLPLPREVAPGGTYEYDGGPANGVPLPRIKDQPSFQPLESRLLNAKVVSLAPAPESASLNFGYRAYGEKLVQPRFEETGLFRVNLLVAHDRTR